MVITCPINSIYRRLREEDIMSTPKHIAIILDGNGRWAKSKGMPRNYGHTVGAKMSKIYVKRRMNWV